MWIVPCKVQDSDNKLEMNFLTFIYCYSWLMQCSAYNHAEIQIRGFHLRKKRQKLKNYKKKKEKIKK